MARDGRTRQLRIRLTDAEHRALERGAKRNGFSMSEAVRQATRAWLVGQGLAPEITPQLPGQIDLFESIPPQGVSDLFQW